MEDLIDIDSFKKAHSTQEDVMEVLEGLPPAFAKDDEFGLGLGKTKMFS